MIQKRCVNPFYHRIKIEPSNLLTIIPGLIFLVPIRIILIISLFLVASSLAKFFIFILRFIDKENDPERYHRWRIIFKKINGIVFRTILFVCGFYRVTIRHKGDPNEEEKSPIYVMAPHTSFFDILAGVVCDIPSSVAKADILDIPLFGSIFLLSDPVLVERDSKSSRQDVFKKVEAVIKYSKIVFFPEGTCSNHRGLLQFKTGAFKFGYPVIPVALRFNQYGPDTLSWTWDGSSTLLSTLLTLARWRTDLSLTKLPVYFPSDQERNDPELYALNVAKILADELQLPYMFYSYDDSRYFKYNFFRSSTNVKFMKLIDRVRQHSDDHKLNTSSLNGQNGSSSSSLTNGNGLPATGTVATEDKSIESKSHSKSSKSDFSVFLAEKIDRIRRSMSKLDLNQTLDQKSLSKLLDIDSAPGLENSTAYKEFLICLKKITSNIEMNHIKLILNLIDLREKNLWKRLESCYEELKNRDDNSLRYDQLKILLWFALNLENIDDDVEIKGLKILSFDDLKNMLISYYDFALEENANAIHRVME